MQLKDCQHLAGLFEAGLTEAVSKLNPERAFVAYRGRKNDSADEPTPYATHGFSMAGLYVDEDISTEVIRQTLREGKSQLIMDAIKAPGLTNRTSVIISGLRSVLSVPMRHSNGLTLGLFYLDNRVKAGAFKKGHEEILKETADAIVAGLGPVEQKMRDRRTTISTDASLSEIRQITLTAAEKGEFTKGLATVEQWIQGREESDELGLAYGIRGRILQQMGQIKSALESVAIAVYILGNGKSASNNENYALMLNNLAGIHVELSNLRRAHGLLTASASYWTKLSNSDPRHFGGLAATQYNLGRLHEGQADSPQGAIDWYEKALASSEQAFGAEHPRTLKIKQSLDGLR